MAPRNFFASQLLFTPPYPKEDWSGKTVIVTGANVGLGFEAARHFVRLGAARVILAVRSTEKGEAAQASIEASTGRRVVEVWPLDLQSYASVKAFAARASAQLDRLDALVENAAIVTEKFRLAEGEESSITVNVTSTFLLAFLLLPKLKDTAQRFGVVPHLVIVSSGAHSWTDLPERKSASIFDALADPTSDMSKRYFASKLLEVFVCRQLVALHPYPSFPVVINYTNPGVCRSEAMREATGLKAVIVRVITALLARTTEVGSRTTVHAASAGPDSHGQYLSDCDVVPPSKFVLSQEGQDTQVRVWNELKERLDAVQPGLYNNL